MQGHGLRGTKSLQQSSTERPYRKHTWLKLCGFSEMCGVKCSMKDIPPNLCLRLLGLRPSRNQKPRAPVLGGHGKGCTGAERGASKDQTLGHRAKSRLRIIAQLSFWIWISDTDANIGYRIQDGYPPEIYTFIEIPVSQTNVERRCKTVAKSTVPIVVLCLAGKYYHMHGCATEKAIVIIIPAEGFFRRGG